MAKTSAKVNGMPKKNSFKFHLTAVLGLVATTPVLLILLLGQLDSLQNLPVLHIILALAISLIVTAVSRSYLNNAIDHELKVIGTLFSHPSEQPKSTPLQAKYSEVQQLLKKANTWLIRKGRARAALKASEERLNLALSTGGFGTWDWDLIKDELNWDSRNHRLHGLKPGTFSGRYCDFLELIHPDDKDLLTQQLSAITESMNTTIHEVEYRIILPDNSVRYLADRFEVFRSSANQIERMVGITWEKSTKN